TPEESVDGGLVSSQVAINARGDPESCQAPFTGGVVTIDGRVQETQTVDDSGEPSATPPRSPLCSSGCCITRTSSNEKIHTDLRTDDAPKESPTGPGRSV